MSEKCKKKDVTLPFHKDLVHLQTETRLYGTHNQPKSEPPILSSMVERNGESGTSAPQPAIRACQPNETASHLIALAA